MFAIRKPKCLNVGKYIAQNACMMSYNYQFTTNIKMDDFFVVRYDSGHYSKQLPQWATKSNSDDIISFDKDKPNDIKLNVIQDIDGCFQLWNVLTNDECDQLINITDNLLGYTQDAPVSLPFSIRHMSNCNWIVNDNICDTIYNRCKPFLPKFITRSVKDKDIINQLGQDMMMMNEYDSRDIYNLTGLNNRFRFYRYEAGDYFKPHTDGSWPHSKIINGQFIDDAYNDGRESAMTVLILLSDDYDGGNTIFYDRNNNQNEVYVKTPKGGIIAFFHGIHDLHMLHEGQLIQRGMKYMIRTELIFEG